MDIQHGCADWTGSMNSMDMHHDMQMDMQDRDMDIKHGYAAWTFSMDMQHGQAA
jgi:hypothetical protein